MALTLGLMIIPGSFSRAQVRVTESSVYGSVTDPDGLPVSDVLVRSAKLSTKTHQDGKYLLQGVEWGKISIEFSKESYKSTSRTVAIKPGVVVELNIRDFQSFGERMLHSNALGLPLNQLTRVGSYLFASSAPDRRTLAAEVLDKGTSGYDIWLLSSGGEKLRVFSQLPDDESNPSWSPRGDAIVFSAYSSRYGYRILSKSVNGKKDFDVVDYGITPSWSPDGGG